MLVLAGVTGSGKTTLARMLGERLGWPVYTVETTRCMREQGYLRRQLCYAELVSSYTLVDARVGIVDNSLLSVYAYTLHYAEMDENRSLYMLAKLVKRLALIEKSIHTVIVVAAPDRRTLNERIREKAARGHYPEEDRTWWQVDHWAVQEKLLGIAERWSIPVVVTEGEQAVEMIAEKVGAVDGVSPMRD